MPTGFIVYLVLTFAWPDEKPFIEEYKEPNLTTCMVKASHILEQAATVKSDEPYQVRAECVMEWPGHDPA